MGLRGSYLQQVDINRPAIQVIEVHSIMPCLTIDHTEMTLPAALDHNSIHTNPT